jgi:hypothetical protein
VDSPKSTHLVKFDMIKTKKFPSGNTGARKGKDLSDIYRDEGKAIALEGYILDWKLEGKEKCNCDNSEPMHRDYHIWLVKNKQGDSFDDAVVVELAPRMREIHKGRWAKREDIESDLAFLKNARIKVRIYGWLMFDGEHNNQIGKPGMDPDRIRRATLWEIHPITRIQSFQNGKWQEQ